jgi:hypothetical protein
VKKNSILHIIKDPESIPVSSTRTKGSPGWQKNIKDFWKKELEKHSKLVFLAPMD